MAVAKRQGKQLEDVSSAKRSCVSSAALVLSGDNVFNKREQSLNPALVEDLRRGIKQCQRFWIPDKSPQDVPEPSQLLMGKRGG
ncbi:hypothetical protein [Rhizobacter fulvus]